MHVSLPTFEAFTSTLLSLREVNADTQRREVGLLPATRVASLPRQIITMEAGWQGQRQLDFSRETSSLVTLTLPRSIRTIH